MNNEVSVMDIGLAAYLLAKGFQSTNIEVRTNKIMVFFEGKARKYVESWHTNPNKEMLFSKKLSFHREQLFEERKRLTHWSGIERRTK